MQPNLKRRIDQHPSAPRHNVGLDCGWGRLIFGQTFPETEALLDTLVDEGPGQRNIAFYIEDPHVLLSLRPQQVFLDPSDTFRLDLIGELPEVRPVPLEIRLLETAEEAAGVNRLYAKARMVPVEVDFLLAHRDDERFLHLVAVEPNEGTVYGTITGIDHVEVFGCAERGSSLWCLAVDPQAPCPGIGAALLRELAGRLKRRGLTQLDLSVMHDNAEAIGLYEKLGFVRVPIFTLKARNSINERLFIGPAPEAEMNPYARIIIDEARRRGIAVEILDAEGGFFRLTHGGRSVVCRESLSELTTAIAMSRCDDKAVTHRLLKGAGLRIPAQQRTGTDAENAAFLERYERIVVKPLRGEQGRGVAVDLRTAEEMTAAIEAARQQSEEGLLEEFVTGQDLRIIVIDCQVVAAAVRRPPAVVGTGRHTIRELIEAQSRRRAAATGGESRIPLDAETRRSVETAGYGLDDVLRKGESLTVRKAANLHTGGTIHDVTGLLHPALREAAEAAARAVDIPVVGFDFLVPDPAGPDYVIIEANERPGLANHEPAPTAQRFVDLLFPHTAEREPEGR